MLLLIGPSFDGAPAAFEQIAGLTGLVPYELKSRIRPGSWGVIRALADRAQATELAEAMRSLGLPVVAVDRAQAWHPERRFVVIDGLRLEADGIVIVVGEREMSVANGALLTIVRGEVGVARPAARRAGPSSATFRAVMPSASDVQVFRENVQRSVDSYPAADLHFITVRWVARIDARSFDFSTPGQTSASRARDLDRLTEAIAAQAGIRIDRDARSNSVSTFANPPQRAPTPVPGSRGPREAPADDPFGHYSRLIGEAELQARTQLSARG